MIAQGGVERSAQRGHRAISADRLASQQADTHVSATETVGPAGLDSATAQLCTTLEMVGPQRVAAVALELRTALTGLIPALLEGRGGAADEEPRPPAQRAARSGPVLADNF